MKKWRLLLLPLLAAVGVFWYLGAHTVSFDRIDSSLSAPAPPAQAERYVSVVPSGSYPGLSDVPVSWEAGRPYRILLHALRAQRYVQLPGFFSPTGGGTAIDIQRDCSPYCMAYWSGGILWLPQDGGWRGYLPVPPNSLDEEFNNLAQAYG